MHPVNGMFLFELGQLWNLIRLPAGPQRANLPLLGELVHQLQLFINSEDNQRDLPDSVDAARALSGTLTALMNEPDQTPSPELAFNVVHQFISFRTLLGTDLGKVYTLVLDEKRGRGVGILWRRPLTLMAAEAVPLLSEFAVKNIEEAGKCLLLDRPTAAGFHTMRSVECVARKYYELVTGRPTEWRDSDGKPCFKMFGGIAQELQDKANSRQKRHEPNGDLELVAGILKPLCRLYRDPLSHSDLRDLEADDAMTAFNQGLDVIAKMALDAKRGGAHFEKSWVAGNLF